MENASRALMMAASVLVAILIISAFVLMMSYLTGYQSSSYDSTVSSQVAEFNNQYTTYVRTDIRGSDMVTLMNKILDYNVRYAQTEGFTEMQINVTISSSIRASLSFDGTNRLITSNIYTQDTVDQIVGPPNSSGTIRIIENRYEQKYANQLASSIATIESIYENNSTESQRNAAFDEEKLLPKNASTYGGVNLIYQDALIYYEYVQFKRTIFDCTNSDYDSATGRIILLEFECTGVGS